MLLRSPSLSEKPWAASWGTCSCVLGLGGRRGTPEQDLRASFLHLPSQLHKNLLPLGWTSHASSSTFRNSAWSKELEIIKASIYWGLTMCKALIMVWMFGSSQNSCMWALTTNVLRGRLSSKQLDFEAQPSQIVLVPWKSRQESLYSLQWGHNEKIIIYKPEAGIWWILTRLQIHHHLDLGLPQLQNCEKQMFVV